MTLDLSADSARVDWNPDRVQTESDHQPTGRNSQVHARADTSTWQSSCGRASAELVGHMQQQQTAKRNEHYLLSSAHGHGAVHLFDLAV